LLNQFIAIMTPIPFESKTMRLVTKSTPLFKDSTYDILWSRYISSKVANFHPKTASGLLSIFKGYLVDSSSSIALL
jgi:hypothetical protein